MQQTRKRLQAEIAAYDTRTRSDLDAHAQKLDMQATDLCKREDALAEGQRALEEMEWGLKKMSTTMADKTAREAESLRELERKLHSDSQNLEEVHKDSAKDQ